MSSCDEEKLSLASSSVSHRDRVPSYLDIGPDSPTPGQSALLLRLVPPAPVGGGGERDGYDRSFSETLESADQTKRAHERTRRETGVVGPCGRL